MPNPFKVGDKIRLNALGRQQVPDLPYLNEYIVTVNELRHDDRIRINWRDHDPDCRYSNEMWEAKYFEIVKRVLPTSFSLNFTDVDDAIRAATLLSPTFGPIEIQPNT